MPNRSIFYQESPDMYVKNYMQAIIVTVSPDNLLSAVRHLMDDLFIRHLPVVLKGNRLIGLITDRDIRQVCAAHPGAPQTPDPKDVLHGLCVSHVMTRQLYTVTPETTLIEAAATFLEQKFDCLPVVDENGILKGLLTVSDFARIYIEEHESVIV
jgi:CBS domain-containing protein